MKILATSPDWWEYLLAVGGSPEEQAEIKAWMRTLDKRRRTELVWLVREKETWSAFADEDVPVEYQPSGGGFPSRQECSAGYSRSSERLDRFGRDNGLPWSSGTGYGVSRNLYVFVIRFSALLEWADMFLRGRAAA